jgi:chemotaxis protein MotA
MRFWIGFFVIFISVIGGYTIGGGHILVLLQPVEFIVIIGSAVGAFFIANNRNVLKHIPAGFKRALTGPQYDKKNYLDLLTMMFVTFKLAKSKGNATLEAHIDKPQESDLFAKYTHFLEQKDAVNFFCDYLRVVTLGGVDPVQMESIMDEELSVKREEKHHIIAAIQNAADGLPALGIVAAVLGVIHTMGSIDQPPAVLGKLIGGALVGTFLGVLLSYGFIGPMGNCLKGIYDADEKYIICIRTALVAYINGFAPLIAIEYARKTLEHDYQPTFEEMEEATRSV